MGILLLGGSMFRLWAKIFKENHLMRDTVIEIDKPKETRTHKIFEALEQTCVEFDLSVPIWLDHNISEFQLLSKTRFHADSFIEAIDFDFLEIQIIEE